MTHAALLETVLLHVFHLSAPAGNSSADALSSGRASARAPAPAPRVETLVTATGLSSHDVEWALAALDRRGLVDAARIRLTLVGLAVAMALGGSQRLRPRPTRVADVRQRASYVGSAAPHRLQERGPKRGDATGVPRAA